MKVPFSWLKQYVDIDVSAEELEKKMFDCGFEVEERIDLGAEISRVVVGVVTECVPQEGTHLHICKVDCGDYGHDIQISTGAPNVYVGMHTPAALDGSTLPGGVKIKARPLMGVESNGMLCSGEELGLNEDLYPGAEVYGLLDLPKDTQPGTPIQGVVGLDDSIFDISITANRADCQSILGIAREVAAVLNKPLKMPATDYTVSDYRDPRLNITVEAPDLCPRYIGHYVRNITTGQSPRWMRRCLALCGLRSISNVVDITNFVMLEIGQPMHAFDMDTLESCQIIVRRAAEGEKITTLDGKEFTLTPQNLVICDGEKPVALAGVMGGLNSEIKDSTTQLLFESAKFARDNIRKTARGLGQNTDASSHYEKGISEYTTELGMARALHLIQELGCGEVTSSHFDCSAGASREGKHFAARISRINAILGITVPTETILDILRRLNFEVELQPDQDTMQVVAPRYREDIEIGEPDLAEEVIREYGYEHIVPTFLKAAQVTSGGLTADQRRREAFKRTMCAQGFYEASTLAFYADADLDALHIAADAPERRVIRILNPISSNLTIMRPLLVPSLLNAAVNNLKKGNTAGRLFEMANVYIPKELPVTELPEERLHLGFVAFGEKEDFFAVKGAMEDLAASFGTHFEVERAEDVPYLHPGVAAYLLCNGVRVGCFGKLANDVLSGLDLPRDSRNSQKIFLGELDYATLTAQLPADVRYQPLSEFPEVARDLALVADEETPCGTVIAEMKRACKQLARVELFDIYRSDAIGAGKKSMAFTLHFAPEGKALEPNDVDRFVKKILGNLKFKLGIEIR
ncbi:MAG: phenylalanine--tRNA ligase subunit beta [Gemmiger sp.]|uniref:phenylalanine--tRNA ligase subunit beta n=1 Tax=Gemmiger sp. TaxID=2049027 RepID=UPI002E7765B8|nr:phenylalanine--tRNA ligase subunit beta [Gemmiger sp.]MEE0800240.1 phenylalanine--tRNA ligase subunit beta [Gemmiger sp.]